MAGCGYVCPQCEGQGWVGQGEICNWCSPLPLKSKNIVSEMTDEEWIGAVHGICACSDIGPQDSTESCHKSEKLHQP